MVRAWRLVSQVRLYRRWQLVTPRLRANGSRERRYTGPEGCDSGDICKMVRDHCDSGEDTLAAVRRPRTCVVAQFTNSSPFRERCISVCATTSRGPRICCYGIGKGRRSVCPSDRRISTLPTLQGRSIASMSFRAVVRLHPTRHRQGTGFVLRSIRDARVSAR